LAISNEELGVGEGERVIAHIKDSTERRRGSKGEGEKG
jgi:hypothetical protein